LVRDNPNKTELHVSHTLVVPLAEHEPVLREAQSSIFGCQKDQHINRPVKNPATDHPAPTAPLPIGGAN
jgi:hypothetical protein